MALFPRVNDFSPLFRLLDDYDVHRSGQNNTSVRGFAPRFDVRESKDAYHLDGELPGLSQNQIDIEFSDPQTLVIKGRVEREYHNSSNGTPAVTDAEASNSNNTGEASTAVQKSSDNKQVSKEKHNHRFWVSERSVGEFHRSFNFPTRVDQDNVKAALKNGVLSLTVPKATAPTGKKILVE